MPRKAPPSRARRAAPNMPRSPREDGVNKPSRGPRGPIAPPVGKSPRGPMAPPAMGPIAQGGSSLLRKKEYHQQMPDRRAGLL
jgi:hypothetical protein